MLRLLALGVEQLGALLAVHAIALVAQNDGPLFLAEHALLLHHRVPTPTQHIVAEEEDDIDTTLARLDYT